MIAVLIATVSRARAAPSSVQRSPLARRAAEKLFLCASFALAYVRSFSFGMCRQRTQLSTSLLSARCVACHAARHELMVVYTGKQTCAKVVRHSRKSRRYTRVVTAASDPTCQSIPDAINPTPEASRDCILVCVSAALNVSKNDSPVSECPHSGVLLTMITQGLQFTKLRFAEFASLRKV